MDLQKQVKMLEAYAGISEAELARRLCMSSQAFGQKVRRGKLSPEELQAIAEAAGASYKSFFEFPDGTRIE